ncbi:hypothetical protein NBRC116584_30370 [Hydrogenophaga sp. 5NK40-0174]
MNNQCDGRALQHLALLGAWSCLGVSGAQAAEPFVMPDTVTIEALSQTLAQKAAGAAVDECTRRGYKVAAAVVGRDGLLLAFLRNPLAGPHTIEVSQRKAYAASTFQVPTSSMASRPDLSFAPGVMLSVGGVPMNVAGKSYGGIAVSGADPAVDEECAQAGVAAIAETLEFGQ